MTINQIRSVSAENARVVVPDRGGYDAVTEDWSETEYRSVELAEDSLGGLWQGAAGTVEFDSWPYTEFCVMIEGRIAVTDREGSTLEFGAGDAFVIPKGFSGSWTTLEASRKYFVGMR